MRQLSMEQKKNDLIQLTIEDMSDTGDGIGKADGFTWFVKDTVIGDTIEAKVMKVKKTYGFAKLIRVLTPSAHRVAPECPVARQCGGCQLQAMSYESQLVYKENKVRNHLRRIGGLELAEDVFMPIIGMENPWRYRNKAQFPFGNNKEGRIVAGFYAGHTHSIIENEDCLVGTRENQAILRTIREYMEEYGIEPYDEITHTGLVRHVLIRKGFRTGELMVCLVINGGVKELKRKDVLVTRLKELFVSDFISGCACDFIPDYVSDRVSDSASNRVPDFVPGQVSDSVSSRISDFAPNQVSDSVSGCVLDPVANFVSDRNIHESEGDTGVSEDQTGKVGQEVRQARVVSICCNINRERTNVIMGKETVNLLGPGYITDMIGTVSYRISPLSFYQVNPAQTERLYSTALSFAGLTGNEVVWDLYCGIGTISLFLAQKAKKVYGVEIIPQAIDDARANAVLNGIDNVEFFVGKAEEVLPEQYEKNHVYADVIVVDPPRKGCDSICLETIVKMRPERVVYISCDSATLARDLKYLCGEGYEVRKVQVVDNFCLTVHVETVVLMSRVEK
ncbi:MAG: 23S rRNA (uracil(1939)-C(5))-methyltransferase RlmD [Clostridiales bacterium]|nr:23S rRNA (uracil(1939)-C(5))-methyltransferase RlmD [Clostridiales bacterium]